MLNEGFDFCRRRLAAASERVSDLAYAVSRLREDDVDAEAVWSDTLALEVRSRDLGPHRHAAERHVSALGAVIEADTAIVAALEEVARMEESVVSAISMARANAENAESRAADARRLADAARSDVLAAEGACASLAGMSGLA